MTPYVSWPCATDGAIVAPRPQNFWWPLALALVLQFALLISYAGCDPPALLAHDHAHIFDNYWYGIDARAARLGIESDVAPRYSQPLMTAASTMFSVVLGPWAGSLRFLVGFGGLVVTLLVALLVRRTQGHHAGIFAAWLLALDPVWNAYARSVAPELLAAAGVVGSVWLAASPRPWQCALGVGLAVTAGAFLHPAAWIVLPAMFWDGWRRLVALGARAGWGPSLCANAELVGVVCAFGAGLATISLASGASLSDLPRNWLELEARVPLFSSFGILLVLAWVSALFTLGFKTRTDEFTAALHRLSTGTLWGGMALIGASGTESLAAFLVLVPFAVLETTRLLQHSVDFAEATPRRWLDVRGFALLGAALVGTLWWLEQWRLATGARSDPSLFIALFAAGLITISVLGLPWLVPRWRWQSSLGGVLALVFVAWAPVWGREMGRATHDLEHASRQLTAILLPSAQLSGPLAAALSIANDLPVLAHAIEPAMPNGEDQRGSHVVGGPEEQPFLATNPRDYEFIEEFHVSGRALRLYRRVRSPAVRSLFELGVADRRAGDPASAENYFYAVLRTWPRLAPAWSQLGECLRAQDQRISAYQCFLNAVQDDPGSVTSHVALASLYLVSGYRREALDHLYAAQRADPDNLDLARESLQLARELGDATENRVDQTPRRDR
ncbi:MAG: hypothetical protein ACKVX7_14540 [Planctomycetota bacterium]